MPYPHRTLWPRNFSTIPFPVHGPVELPIPSVPSTRNSTNYVFEVGASLARDRVMHCIVGTTPWFDAWRDCFLRIVYSGDHEFLKNYLACK